MGKVRTVVGFVWGLFWASSAHAAEPLAAVNQTEARHVEPERARLLADQLGRYSTLAAIEPYLPAMTGALCTAGTVALAAGDTNEMHLSTAALLTPTIACAAVGFGSYLLPRDYWVSVSMPMLLAAPSALLMMDVLAAPEITTAEEISLLSLTGSGLAVSSLYWLDTALSRPVSWGTLVNHAVTLRAGGSSLSGRQVAGFEADFRRAEQRPIPRWAYGLAQMVGGAVALAPAFSPQTDKRDRGLAAGLGVAMLLPGATSFVAALVSPNRYERYTSALTQVHLSPLGPSGAAGLWVGGAF